MSAARLSTRAKVLLRRSELDRQLAAGADTAASAELRCRAGQLARLRQRRQLAAGLDRAIRMAERPGGAEGDSGPIDCEEVGKARLLLVQLAEWLRQPDPVDARAAAIAKCLLTETDSPLFAPGWRTDEREPGELGRWAKEALGV